MYGTIPPTNSAPVPTQVSYTMDNSTPMMYVTPTTDDVQYNQLFFQYFTLDATIPHTLVVTNIAQDAQFYVDYVGIVLPPT
ncbi:hypothetical protein BDN70DRAFT_531817 [Pholiota conissans]|uniref:Uncharacterized protein n=1 Tax=Pholiota conissans TaxID=109636 RepID=A0A9P5YM96_9AGAR|nr:hypothetical protein BDN70DRAFT_531817 [Pholiota conissans]